MALGLGGLQYDQRLESLRLFSLKRMRGRGNNKNNEVTKWAVNHQQTVVHPRRKLPPSSDTSKFLEKRVKKIIRAHRSLAE